MKTYLYIALLGCLALSCSDYQKALKSDDTALKFKAGTQMFENEKWAKAHRVFDLIIKDYRGKPQGEKLTYMHAYSSYKMKNYYTAAYHFERFANSYSKSEKAEEALFLEAKCYYHISPRYSREQKETIEALEKFQLFVNQFPNSEYLPEANELVKKLDFKLEKKAFEIAKQYDIIRDYKASVKSFNNFLLDFPGATLRNDALYYRFDAASNLALKSIKSLQEERANDALKYYDAYNNHSENSEYTEEAKRTKAKLEALIQELNSTKNPS